MLHANVLTEWEWLTTSFTHPLACRQTTQSVSQQPFSHLLHHPPVRMYVTGWVRVINWMINWVNEWSINRVSVCECMCERVRACVRARANEWASESVSQWYLISVSWRSHYLSSENKHELSSENQHGILTGMQPEHQQSVTRQTFPARTGIGQQCVLVLRKHAARALQRYDNFQVIHSTE